MEGIGISVGVGGSLHGTGSGTILASLIAIALAPSPEAHDLGHRRDEQQLDLHSSLTTLSSYD
jgi:hypothetical protein